MNRYPFWKYIIILITLLVGVIFVMLNLLSDMLYQFFDPRTKS